jgi:hypothetical protein
VFIAAAVMRAAADGPPEVVAEEETGEPDAEEGEGDGEPTEEDVPPPNGWRPPPTNPYTPSSPAPPSDGLVSSFSPVRDELLLWDEESK